MSEHPVVQTKAALEAVLFSSPQPVSPDRLAQILSIQEKDVRGLLAELEAEYRDPRRGFMLEWVAGGVRLCSKGEYASYVSELGREVRSGGLSQAALESLAIIAYRQPITRPQIEAIRGVRVGSAIASLIDRGLIEEKGRAEGPGRPILYGTTDEFLIRFNLNSLDELPPIKAADGDETPDGQARLPIEPPPDAS